MNPDLNIDIFSDIFDSESINYKDIFNSLDGYMDFENDISTYISTLDYIKKRYKINLSNDKKRASLKELIELYLNSLLLGYENKFSIEERECFLHQIKLILESESSNYSDEEIKSFFDINYLEKILFSLNLDESIEYLEVITGKLLKIIKSNKIEYINPNKLILTDDLLNSLVSYY